MLCSASCIMSVVFITFSAGHRHQSELLTSSCVTVQHDGNLVLYDTRKAFQVGGHASIHPWMTSLGVTGYPQLLDHSTAANGQVGLNGASAIWASGTFGQVNTKYGGSGEPGDNCCPPFPCGAIIYVSFTSTWQVRSFVGAPMAITADKLLCFSQGCSLYLQCGLLATPPYDPVTGTELPDVPYKPSTVYQTPAPANAQLPCFLSVEDTNIQIHDNTGKTVFCAPAGDPGCNTSG